MIRKTGFTLIETIASISILLIFMSISISMYKLKASLESDINVTDYIYEIQNLITYGKSVCKEKENYGKLLLVQKIIILDLLRIGIISKKVLIYHMI